MDMATVLSFEIIHKNAVMTIQNFRIKSMGCLIIV